MIWYRDTWFYIFVGPSAVAAILSVGFAVYVLCKWNSLS